MQISLFRIVRERKQPRPLLVSNSKQFPICGAWKFDALKPVKFFSALHRAATRLGSNVRGSVHTLTDKSMALWDKVRKRLGNSDNSAGCSCGREYPNSEGVFYEDYFTR